MDRILGVLAGVLGFLAVGLGAFGAHGLRGFLASVEDGALRLGWWETAAHYHLSHALAVGLAAFLVARGGTAAVVAGCCFVLGTLLFSGSLYTMTLTGVRALGAVTPVGGLFFLAGWAALAVAAYRGFAPVG